MHAAKLFARVLPSSVDQPPKLPRDDPGYAEKTPGWNRIEAVVLIGAVVLLTTLMIGVVYVVMAPQ